MGCTCLWYTVIISCFLGRFTIYVNHLPHYWLWRRQRQYERWNRMNQKEKNASRLWEGNCPVFRPRVSRNYYILVAFKIEKWWFQYIPIYLFLMKLRMEEYSVSDISSFIAWLDCFSTKRHLRIKQDNLHYSKMNQIGKEIWALTCVIHWRIEDYFILLRFA